MKHNRIQKNLVIHVICLLLIGYNCFSQIRVVNMVPLLQSNQTRDDNETNIAVNPANRLQIAGTAFTPDPMGGANAPIYISTDGGVTWALNSIIPGNDPFYGSNDISLRFAGFGNRLYVGDLKGGATLYTMNILRIPDYTSSALADLMVTRSTVDQPYVQATTVLGGAGATKDRVYITANDRGSSPLPAGINLSLDAFSAPAPSGFVTNLFPNRATTTRVMPGVRPTIHNSGIVYIAFYNVTSAGSDVIVARDDNWGSGATPFRNLNDLGDGLPGQKVVTGRTLPAFGGTNLGGSRLVASNISIAVDPRDASIVYISWADRVGTTDYTLHVRSSTDFGQHWSADLLTITNATNPALAVNIKGKLGFLYQALTGTGSSQRWETHLRRSTNAGSTWDDVTLSTALVSDPGSWLGDYEHLMAVGKDFYGIFSASNYPDMANFPQGVTYQRNANFTTHQLLGTDGVTVIGVSKDPFFFQVTEMDDNTDFFVRDFTHTVSDFDPGLEPSTDPWFFVNSDVWNMRSNTPGTFNANNQPQSEDPWQTTDGHNYGFARVHRKAAGAAENVNLHFLYSEFGTGSNYVNANTTADPTLAFGAADVELVMASGYEWELPVTTSNHTCIAVEVSTSSDPIITPSLLGHAPGWSNGTDLMVLNDNNKAQRNMEVYHVPMGGSAAVSSYAAIHNPGLNDRNILINWRADLNPRLKIRPSVQVIGTREKAVVTNNGILLANMKPGETRFIRITYPIYGNKEGVVFPVGFGETKNGIMQNGFTVAREYSSLDKVIAQNLKYEALVLRRISNLYKNSDAEKAIKYDLEFLDKNQFTADYYYSFYKRNIPLLKSITKEVIGYAPNDPFGLNTALSRIDTMLILKKVSDLAIVQLSFLNALDACLTTIELRKGNTADYLQTVYIQKDIAQLMINKGKFDAATQLAVKSGEFIQSVEQRKMSLKDYAENVKSVLPLLRDCAAKIANNSILMKQLSLLEESMADTRRLQNAHLTFLLQLKNSIKLGK